MKEKIFNKLVRDKIPEIIKKNDEIPIIRILDDAAYIEELNTKLLEEVNEYLKDDNLEELADILEVFMAILNAKNINWVEIEKIRNEKIEKRGAFNQKIFLEKKLYDKGDE